MNGGQGLEERLAGETPVATNKNREYLGRKRERLRIRNKGNSRFMSKSLAGSWRWGARRGLHGPS